jgi:aminoglycoside phosphotransferase (APT) family kinase protein
MAELIEPLPQHRFSTAALWELLQQDILEAVPPFTLQQFQGGQSNPTFRIDDSAEHAYVLRKKPPGDLLPSAHAVEREYAVMRALAATDVEVPRMRLLCEDASVIGTPFYVMDYVQGRVLTDLRLTSIPVAERAAYYFAMADGLARLHRVNWRELGLAGFGRPDGYVARQIARWTKQYLASGPDANADMLRLIDYLPAHIPAEEPAVIAHGDYRLGNLMFDQDAPVLKAILDWELATLGDPLSDLAYLCSFYHLPHDQEPFRGLGGLDTHSIGIPSEAMLLARYCESAGRSELPANWPFYLAFSLFRSAAIGQGVYDRSRRGNAADSRAALYQQMVVTCARAAWSVASPA